MSSDRTSHAPSNGFDPFGEPLRAERTAAPPRGDRRANRVAATVFWVFVAAILVGRACLDIQPLEVGRQIVLALLTPA